MNTEIEIGEYQWLCICIFASQNCQALSSHLTSDYVKANMCLQLSFHLSGFVCLCYFHVCPIFIRAMGNKNLQLTAWLINCTQLSSTRIFLTGERCITITIKLYCMTEHCLLIGVVGFTTSGISCLTEFLLSLKLSGRKESCQRKSASWKNMFFKTLSTSVRVCAALLLGCTLTRMSTVHGSINPVVNKTRKSCAYTCTLSPDFLKYKKVLCKMNCLPKKQMDESQTTENCLHAYKNTRCKKEDISHLLKYYRIATIKGIGHVRIIGLRITSVSMFLLCNTAAVIFSNYQPRYPTNHRASHSKLRLMLLFTVSWCSFSSLPVTVQQSGCSCKVHHKVFGISFVLCISCDLGKTKLELMAFRATFPGNIMKWFGTPQQRLSVFAFIIYQDHISLLWLMVNSSSFNKNMKSQKEKIIIQRSLGSVIQILCILGQLGLVDVP
ncbi:uncharacterized protein LOC117597529 [Pangasianodon hypophthalmus]|uniref:uncharacterized protein LOC117597529 n=1 Tax=Pangasianodon hypophthalmus TaxID=310915 RepID=UPI00147C8C50|nr:uncharacterized protein LOC117597529 [Pangasianodon hypophthalmus]